MPALRDFRAGAPEDLLQALGGGDVLLGGGRRGRGGRGGGERQAIIPAHVLPGPLRLEEVGEAQIGGVAAAAAGSAHVGSALLLLCVLRLVGAS